MAVITAHDEVLLNEALNYITDILLAFSLFGCVATIVTFLIFHEMRTYPIKLIIYLCVSIFFAQLFFYLTFYLYNTILCIPCAMILHYFFLTSFFWTFCVAFNFYQMIVRRNRDAERIERYYHLVSWSVPLAVVTIVVAMDSYINRGGYCYMYPGLPIFLSFFVPGLVIVAANLVIFFFIAREIHDTLKNAPKADKKEKSKEFRVYFSIFVSIGLSWILGFIMSFLTDVEQVIFLVLYSVLTPLQGFLIFVSYCFNAKVGGKWAGLFGKMLPFLRKYEGMGLSSIATMTETTSGANAGRGGTTTVGSASAGFNSTNSRASRNSVLSVNTVSLREATSQDEEDERNSAASDEI